MSEISTVIWDGDNTLWDWMEYAVPAYEAMCAEIARISGKSEDETAEAMKVFYTSKGTIEDAGLIQGLQSSGFFNEVGGFDIGKTVQRVQRIFSNVRSKNLNVYEGITDSVRQIHNRGIRQILLTDAPLVQANGRMKHTKLRGYFSDIHAMPAAVIPNLHNRFRETESSVITNPANHVLTGEKPHTDLAAILSMTRDEIAATVAIVGDNDSKDMELARQFNCVGIHAEYGAAQAELVQRLQKFAPPRVARRNMQIGDSPQNSGTEKRTGATKIMQAKSPHEIMGLLFDR